MLLDISPEYSSAYTYIGDAYYLLGDYSQARTNFEEAIKCNFIDYQAHWFLADALQQLGDSESAVKEITIAHLLNVNHPDIVNKLKQLRDIVNRPWKEWEFNPQYSLDNSNDTIFIKANPDWTIYALVKAIWKFEPGYAEKMVGPDRKNDIVIIPEEKEAIVGLVSGNEHFENIREIIEDGFFMEFVYYEIYAPIAPESMDLMPRDTFNRIIEYINRYH